MVNVVRAFCATSSFQNLKIVHFGNGNDRLISHHFPTAWPSRSSDLNPFNVYLRGCLKNFMFSVPDRKFSFTENTDNAKHSQCDPLETFQSVLENAFYRFKFVVKMVNSILNIS